jgi:hypothetical protein
MKNTTIPLFKIIRHHSTPILEHPSRVPQTMSGKHAGQTDWGSGWGGICACYHLWGTALPSRVLQMAPPNDHFKLETTISFKVCYILKI